MYTLVPQHVDDDMRWMADHGVDGVAIGILEQDFQASWRNLDHLFAAAERHGIKIRFTPSRWCGLFAGAGKVPSMWACNHPEAWSLDEQGQPRVNKYSGLICSVHHPAVFDFITQNIEQLITRWPVAGIIWDELKTLHLTDHHPLAIDALGAHAGLEQHVQATADFYDRINAHAKSLRPDLVTSMFIYAHCAGAEVDALSNIAHLDEYGCDGRPWNKADEQSDEFMINIWSRMDHVISPPPNKLASGRSCWLKTLIKTHSGRRDG